MMKIGYDGGLTLALGVTSLERSVPWYRKLLDGTIVYQLEDIAWCEFSTPVARVTLGLSEVEAVTPGGVTPTFGVVDIDAAKAALDAEGIRQDGPVQEIPDMVRLLTFYDPDGNALMFYQDLGAQA